MNESDCDELSLDSLNSNDKREVMIKDNGKKEGMHEGLRDNKGGILLDKNKRILKLV